VPKAARILNICRVEINPFLQNMSVNFTANNFKITVFSNATIGIHGISRIHIRDSGFYSVFDEIN
jgi:hypothetical protein